MMLERALPHDVDVLAPDGSEVRILARHDAWVNGALHATARANVAGCGASHR